MFEKITSILVGFTTHFLGAAKVACSFIFARILSAMGLTFVNYQYVLPEVKQFIVDQGAAMDGTTMQLAGVLGVDVFMTMIISALVAKVGMKVVLAGIAQLQGMIDGAGG